MYVLKQGRQNRKKKEKQIHEQMALLAEVIAETALLD